MNHETISKGCPWRVTLRGSWYCKALVGQPNGSQCNGSNCAMMHIAHLITIELKGGYNENATSAAASTGGDKS